VALGRINGRVGDVSLVGVGILVRWGVGGDEFGAGGEVEVGEDGESLGSVEGNAEDEGLRSALKKE